MDAQSKVSRRFDNLTRTDLTARDFPRSQRGKIDLDTALAGKTGR